MAEALTSALTNAGTIVTQGIGIITANELCMVFCGLALLRGGLRTFGTAKHIAM